MTLSFVNDGSANDDHIEVAELIFHQGKSPAPQDCWQCYQPKFYHLTVAKLSHLLQIQTRESRTILAQLLNGIAGILTLLLCWIFIRKQPFSEPVRLLCFATVALNPRFIAIHTQSSNDAFIIFFGTLLLYSLYRWMERPSIKYFSILLIVSVLAGWTKGSSIILFFGISIVMIIKIILSSNYKIYFPKLFLYSIITFLLVGYLGEYFNNYQKYGKPVVYNTPITDFPDFYKKTTFRRAGVQSVVEGYFTFRLFDMIQHPIITNGYTEAYPKHRTSVWSQLYGRAHFLYFDNWPSKHWQSTDPRMMNLGRISLTLALIPTIALLFGWWKDFRYSISLFFRRKWKIFRHNQEWLFHIFIIGFMLFIILFTARGRDYSFMKVIYLFPMTLAVLIPMMKGWEYVFVFLQKNKILLLVFYSLLAILFISYIIPVLDLISKLNRG